jgi:3-oxoacyl-[acyl-carrier protein] reductase
VGGLAGKVALVTGSSRGIGRATVLRLARDGAHVVINYSSSRAEAERVLAEVEAVGGSGLVVQANLNQVDDIRQLFAATLDRFGRLDVVVQNAGQALSKPHTSVTEEEFDQLFAVNACGTFFVLQEAARHIADGGRIVYISSGSTVLNLSGGGAYGGSKIAGERFVKDLAVELGPRGVTVNALIVGAVETRNSRRPFRASSRS